MNYGEFLSSFLIDLQRLFRAELSTSDLTYSQILAIISIPDSGIEMSELSLVLGLDNSTVTRLVIRLENKFWVERKKSRRDQRAVKVFLTNKGVKVQQNIEKKIDKIGKKINLEVNEVEKEALLNSLSSFQWRLKKLFLKK
jgi:DNA-binding MarR family transcriptional regulator